MMDKLNQNNGKSREEKSVNTTNVYVEGELFVDPKDIPVYRALNSAKQDFDTGVSNGLNGKHLNSKPLNGNGYMNGNGTGSINGNGTLNVKNSMNGTDSLNGNSMLNGKSMVNGKGTNGNSVNGNGMFNGKQNGSVIKEINGNDSAVTDEEQSPVFKGIKYFNTDDQSFSFTIEKPRYVVLIVTNRLTMREEILVNEKLMPGDYIVMLNREMVTPGFHYYKLYYESDGKTPDSYRFNDIKPEMKFYLETIKEVTVL